MNQRDCLVCDLWHAGVHADEIGRRLGVSASRVYSMAHKLQLPRRGRQESQADDPTPEEIAERVAYCRRMREAGTPIGGS